MSQFICFSVSPINLAHPGIAVATTRAGGIGILDREFCHDPKQASNNLDKLLALTNPGQSVGIRLSATQVASSHALLKRLSHQPHWLILCGWNAKTLVETVASLPTGRSRKLLLEITDIEQAQALDNQIQNINIDGLIARGHESGGWVGEDSAFILLQKLLSVQSRPVYVQGGIGIHTAAACRAAGAAGVVLDDQLWLMPESPLPQEWQRHLSNLNGQEAMVLGERLNAGCRVLSRPGFQAITNLQQLADQIEVENDGSADGVQNWQQQAQPLIGWGEPGKLAWPMGQAVGLAATFRDRYPTIGKLIQALLKQSQEQIKTAQQLRPLDANAPLAVSHGTQYPIVQGPMTRVSDTAEFANAVSQAGGLPMLALALMRGSQVRSLLQKTQQLMGNRAWGIGMLGFVSHALREEQIQAVKEFKPPFALIAGGRPDQAAQFEAEGIATYIHVPAPRLLKMFLEQGARRFVFEGRECGGHVGPLSSFVLWESMIATLLADVPPGKESEIHVLFAGGIHDALSAAMIAAMAAPLVERGMRIGVLMGTAYLFTQEAVACGAIVQKFQEQALACSRTINLETGPGHASRCVFTPFAQEFYATRRQMMAAGSPPEEIKDTLEDLTLGRLRIASKGLQRTPDGQVQTVDEAQQLTNGMYMIGQVATLRDQVCTVRELHQNVSEIGTKLLISAFVEQDGEQKVTTRPSDIAIIGIGTLLPQAQYPETFWNNILRKVDAITEIPAQRWDWRLYYNPDRNARDKVYSKWGGFLEDVPFDPLRFGIPPKSLKSIEPVQLLALETVRRALEDAGYGSGNFDREHTSVILGAGGGIADLGQQYATRCEIPRMVGKTTPEVWDRLPEWTEESFPGLLLNVIAGRVANRFDFGGHNFTVDAACASSLAALDLAVKELESGRSNVAIAGGVDTVQSPFAYFCFSKTQALSPRGRSRTFDKTADGIAISEGIAVVVLKRLADAERDGDRIYGVIKAVASSSDGKALGMTAPLPAGQMRALRRAYKKAGFSPNTLGLYEAHGTGTPAGDKAELETVISVLKEYQAHPKCCAIGSVKTSIGHTKSTAGIAGVIKAVLALHHKVKPPHMNVDTPLDPIIDHESPVYLPKEAQPWLAHPDHPRRAGVSAFGFGGTNFHAVLEEYRGNWQATAPGADAWPYELFVFRAENRAALAQEAKSLLRDLSNGAEPRLQDLAHSFAQRAQTRQNQSACLAIVAESLSQLRVDLEIAIAQLEGRQSQTLPPHIQFGMADPQANQQVAFLFPGQGSQYSGMARETGLYFNEIRGTFEFADRQLRQCFPKLLSQYVYPPSPYSEEEEKQNYKQLMDTRIAQPAIGAVETGLMDLAARLELKPVMVGGHSFGEYAALHAAGVLSREDFFNLAATRGRVMAEACATSVGAMAAVQTTREDLLLRLQNFEGVVIANQNAPRQSVISGDKQVVQQVVDSLNAAGITARMLPVSGAFHSALVASAQAALAAPISTVTMHSPRIPVYANSTGRPYGSNINDIRSQLSKQLLNPVEFLGQINAMYADGARIFVELGPKHVLTNLVGQILAQKEHTAVSLDGQGGGLRGLLMALGTLFVRGVHIKLTALFDGRDVQNLNLAKLVELTRKPALPPTTWLINGGSARPQNQPVGYTGKLPPLNQETAALIAPLPELSLGLKPQATPTQPVPIQEQPTPKPQPHTHLVSKKPEIPMNQPATSSTPANGKSLNGNSSPLPVPANPPQQAMGAGILQAYQAYQETMRKFLAVQEQVMSQLLATTNSVPTLTPATTPLPPRRQPENHLPPAPQPVVVQPKNGSAPTLTPNNKQEQIPVAPQPLIPQPVSAPPVQEMVVKQVPAPPATTQFLPDRASLTQTLLGLVSERTGYPADMLGLDQDMEAELGIDSIKRVEILGAFNQALPASLADSVRQQMEQLTRVKSLNGIVDKILENLQPTAAATVTNTVTAANISSASVGESLNQTELTQTLLQLVSDRTGYPTDMLGLDQDLEAELGIDSIKRVEILGALQKSLPQSLATSVQARMESLTRVKSLNSIVEQVLAISAQENGLGKSPAQLQVSHAT
ncbi:type I polyketide synthase [Fischerella thermalis]|uniref:type I polyketide synthase n=1 Tax=Fischerella thermalis TaxID=372787 RepID=UPI00030C3863|nr:type I polyketide synthase [Fischerella thermalis]PMB30543.1 6-deoxyerythronolide-B synthase [Fischerella thermalis CCMEE 5208]